MHRLETHHDRSRELHGLTVHPIALASAPTHGLPEPRRVEPVASTVSTGAGTVQPLRPAGHAG